MARWQAMDIRPTKSRPIREGDGAFGLRGLLRSLPRENLFGISSLGESGFEQRGE